MRTLPLLTAVLIFSAPVTAARASAPGFCRGYADTAAWQYRIMRDTPGCARPPSNFWHPDRGLHYGWCLGASPYAVKDQTRRRNLVLSACDPSYGD